MSKGHMEAEILEPENAESKMVEAEKVEPSMVSSEVVGVESSPEIEVPEAEVPEVAQKLISDSLPDLSNARFALKVFGCQMNRSDAENMAGLLCECGARQVDDSADADITIFVTCCVREHADSRVYGQIASMCNDPVAAGSAIGRRIVAVGGCMAQRDGESLLDKLPNVDVVFGTHNISELPQMLASAIYDGERIAKLQEDAPPADAMAPRRRENSFQAWLPIMKGCNNYCTYCVVPYVRGREMSRPLEDVVKEAQFLVADGVREITLLGQNVNSYGRDLYGKPRFAEVLRAVADTGIDRLRFVTSHPKDLSDATIEAMAELDCVMPQLHLPVQSGSNSILKAMNRRYTRESYLERVEALRSAVDGIALSTDVIVGFPGETQKDFDQTCDLVEKVGYSQAFTFIYSKRQGTPAATMPDDTPREVIQQRFDFLVKIVQDGAYKANQAELGQVVQVLVEGPSKRDPSMMSGRSPKNQTVHFPLDKGVDAASLVGQMIDVKVDLARTWYLSGQAV